MNDNIELQATVGDGKYTVTFYKNGELSASRHGQECWRNLTGDGLVLAMLQEIAAWKQLAVSLEFRVNVHEAPFAATADDIAKLPEPSQRYFAWAKSMGCTTCQPFAKAAWDEQQKRIDALEQELTDQCDAFNQRIATFQA